MLFAAKFNESQVYYTYSLDGTHIPCNKSFRPIQRAINDGISQERNQIEIDFGWHKVCCCCSVNINIVTLVKTQKQLGLLRSRDIAKEIETAKKVREEVIELEKQFDKDITKVNKSTRKHQ